MSLGGAVVDADQWEDRTLAQVAQTGVHPASDAVDAGRCAPPDSTLRGSLRQAEIHAARDRKLEEARRQRQLRRQRTASSTFVPGAATMTSPGETEAGTAGMQPC